MNLPSEIVKIIEAYSYELKGQLIELKIGQKFSLGAYFPRRIFKRYFEPDYYDPERKCFIEESNHQGKVLNVFEYNGGSF